MPTVAVRFSLCGLIRRSRRSASPVLRALSSNASGNLCRGGLPRFHSPSLPTSKRAVDALVTLLMGFSFLGSWQGNAVRIQGDEFWHMTKVLRLGPNDRVELFDGKGGLVEGCIQSVSRTGLDIIALQEPQVVDPQGVQWHIYAAFGTLKGGRADWLVEKCTELGASSVTPLLTERSHTITENRVERLERVVLAAVKQCQRLHQMTLNPPMKFRKLLPMVSNSKFAFLAVAEATPLVNVLSESTVEDSGLLIVGPEGDFTNEEVKLLIEAGATAVGLGPCRLRVETATVALLSTLMLWSDAQKLQFPLQW
ncbi:unnamed protein product [Musa hybrid cultivar]